jgi:hypothetical protein
MKKLTNEQLDDQENKKVNERKKFMINKLKWILVHLIILTKYLISHDK